MQFALTLLFATQLLGLVWGGLLSACRGLLVELLTMPLRLIGITGARGATQASPRPPPPRKDAQLVDESQR